MPFDAGLKPWNWTAEPITDPRGYILVHIGSNHHLADIRGYTYQHRLIAEEMLGRRLDKRDRVRHRDKNPSNNERSNLVLTRTPENVEVSCECACGAKFMKYDRWGRPRRYLSGHNIHNG